MSRLMLATVALFFIPVALLAHQGASGIIKTRMDAMGEISESMKTLGRMFRGATLYDSETARAAALTIRAHAGERLTELFPEDSLQQPSEALPEIWEDWETFSAIADQTERFSIILAEAAENPPSDAPLRINDIEIAEADPNALAGGPPDHAFAFLAKTCTACHEQFRQNND